MPLTSYFPKVKGRKWDCKQAPNMKKTTPTATISEFECDRLRLPNTTIKKKQTKNQEKKHHTEKTQQNNTHKKTSPSPKKPTKPLLVRKKIRRPGWCSWTTTHNSGSENLSVYFLKYKWKQNK